MRTYCSFAAARTSEFRLSQLYPLRKTAVVTHHPNGVVIEDGNGKHSVHIGWQWVDENVGEFVGDWTIGCGISGDVYAMFYIEQCAIGHIDQYAAILAHRISFFNECSIDSVLKLSVRPSATSIKSDIFSRCLFCIEINGKHHVIRIGPKSKT